MALAPSGPAIATWRTAGGLPPRPPLSLAAEVVAPAAGGKFAAVVPAPVSASKFVVGSFHTSSSGSLNGLPPNGEPAVSPVPDAAAPSTAEILSAGFFLSGAFAPLICRICFIDRSTPISFAVLRFVKVAAVSVGSMPVNVAFG